MSSDHSDPGPVKLLEEKKEKTNHSRNNLSSPQKVENEALLRPPERRVEVKNLQSIS